LDISRVLLHRSVGGGDRCQSNGCRECGDGQWRDVLQFHFSFLLIWVTPLSAMSIENRFHRLTRVSWCQRGSDGAGGVQVGDGPGRHPGIPDRGSALDERVKAMGEQSIRAWL
jgi:hypothetical protein